MTGWSHPTFACFARMREPVVIQREYPGGMGIGADNSCVRSVAIHSRMKLFIHHTANDALRAFEREPFACPVVGVDMSDPSDEQGVYKISVLNCRDEVQGLYPSQRKEEEYDEQQGRAQRLDADCESFSREGCTRSPDGPEYRWECDEGACKIACRIPGI